MGLSSSKVQHIDGAQSMSGVSSHKPSFARPDVVYAHYTPSTFPLVPQLKPEYMPLCRKTWQAIVRQRQRDPEHGTDVMGITAFYNEFYERLAKIDSQGLYETILMRNALPGTSHIAAKGSILVRIVDFLLKLNGDTPEVRQQLNTLGHAHTSKGIRPWQYSIFLELFILTLGSRLQKRATASAMEAWVNLLAFALKHMLPPAIEGQVMEYEAHVNFALADDR